MDPNQCGISYSLLLKPVFYGKIIVEMIIINENYVLLDSIVKFSFRENRQCLTNATVFCYQEPAKNPQRQKFIPAKCNYFVARPEPRNFLAPKLSDLKVHT